MWNEHARRLHDVTPAARPLNPHHPRRELPTMPSTRVEMRLRARIDQLRDERDDALEKARRLTVVKPRTRMKRCVYCGAVCRGKACHAHSDLLAIDPYYQEQRWLG